MAEANQFVFSHKELVTLLIKAAGVHEGLWMPLINFNLTAGNVGPSADALQPTALVAVSQVGIQRLQPGLPGVPTENNLAVDAGKVNPKPKGTAIKVKG